LQAIGDLLSLITGSIDPSNFFHYVYATTCDLFKTLDRETPKATIVINMCQELEPATLAALGAYDVVQIGSVLLVDDEADLFKQDDAKYIEWLDAQPASSVVCVPFRSLARMVKHQAASGPQGEREAVPLHCPKEQQGGARRG
jgi:hypothetical protein